MRTEDWIKVEELLNAALELEPAERRKFLDEIEAGAPDLRREVESLLVCEEKVDGFLDAPALAFSADFFDDDNHNARVGQEIGNYRILREIGRGGMGAVFLAERADGAFEQVVALKVMRYGFLDSELARRFSRERQILASLNHPNIARLMDGGVSAMGEPFLVMEYVEGLRIDDYCNARNLSTSERLQLFLKVCRGVSYAHQHLVVHRDIKPSNIIVVEDKGGKPTPKLLDFGIAKLLDPEQASEHTQTEMRAFTPDYASPEQISGGQITTASDVFSLGVLLQVLLHGASFSSKARKASNGGRSETHGQKTVAAKRSTNQKNENGRAKTNPLNFASAELKNIIAMARREDPARRYASAAQLAEDVQRYLDGLPVQAQKDSFTYRAGKFVRRNKAGVAAAAIILLTLVGGIIATVWQARRATLAAQIAAQERDRARVEAAKAERINAFLQSIFASADPSWYSTGFGQRGEVKVVDVLELAGRRIDEELKDEPLIRAELHHTIGTTYQALGRFESAKTHFRAAVEAYRGLYGERHPEVAEALYYLGASIDGGGDRASARDLYRQSLEVFRAVDPNNANVPYLLADLSGTLNDLGESVLAEQAAREGLEIARQKYGDEHVLTTTLLSRLGVIYQTRGDLRQAETFYQTGIAIFNRMPNGRVLALGWEESLGHLSFYRGDFRRAEAQYRAALDIMRETLNETHPRRVNLMLMLAEVHYFQGAYADAEKVCTSALDLLRRIAPSAPYQQLKGLSLLSLIHAKTNRSKSAAVFLRQALAMFESAPDIVRYQDGGLVGEALIVMKRETEAKSLLLERYTFFARTYGEQNPQATLTRRQLERLGASPP